MGGALNSAKGFLGMGGGPEVGVAGSNQGLSQLNGMEGAQTNPYLNDYLNQYASGQLSSSDALSNAHNQVGAFSPEQEAGFKSMLATNPVTGSKFATEQVQNNPILGQLFGEGGQLSKGIGQYGQQSSLLDNLQNQGYQLKPEDQSLYGQASGNIARQFGQQGNQTANSLASRGLSSSGAAGAAFSGLAGNQNEQLAQAQQNIMQQRFQNTMNQIGQQQQFLSSLGNNITNMGNSASSAINQQYGRQLSGAQEQREGLMGAGGLQNQYNSGMNTANLDAAKFKEANSPQNFMDFATAGAGQGIQSGIAGTPGGNATTTTNEGGKKTTTTSSSQGSGMAGMFAGL